MIYKLLLVVGCLTSALAQINRAESFAEGIALTQTSVAVGGAPEVQDSEGVGFSTLEYDGDARMLIYLISFQELSGAPTMVDFSGPAPINGQGPIQIQLPGPLPASVNGTLQGTAVLDDIQHVDILSGLWYINIRTTRNPDGEIRGQVNALGRGIPESTIVVNQAVIDLSTDQTVPLVSQNLDGSGTIEIQVTDTDPAILSWGLQFQGLSGGNVPLAANFHGPAQLGQIANPQVPISTIPFSSPNVGQVQITRAQADELVAGLWYVNIETQANPGGEIRGQIMNVELAIVEGNLGGAGTQSTSLAALLITIFVTLFVLQ